MTNLKDFLSGKKYIYLNSIHYISHSDECQTKPKVNCIDKYSCEYKGNAIEVTATRSVDFSPKCFFSAEISYTVIHEFDENKYDDFRIEEYDLSQIVEEDKNYYIPDEMDRVSLILAQITDSFEGRPLITAPYSTFEQTENPSE